jgi:hypothetical protein
MAGGTPMICSSSRPGELITGSTSATRPIRSEPTFGGSTPIETYLSDGRQRVYDVAIASFGNRPQRELGYMEALLSHLSGRGLRASRSEAVGDYWDTRARVRRWRRSR